MKICSTCKIEKDLEAFARSGKSRDGRQYTCRSCQSERWKTIDPEKAKRYRADADLKRAASQREKSRRTDPDVIRERQYRSRYGITIEQYDELLTAQQGGCAICGHKPGKRRLHVDHCHSSNTVRGLLCSNCNQGLGHFRDDPNLLNKAARYLWR